MERALDAGVKHRSVTKDVTNQNMESGVVGQAGRYAAKVVKQAT